MEIDCEPKHVKPDSDWKAGLESIEYVGAPGMENWAETSEGGS